MAKKVSTKIKNVLISQPAPVEGERSPFRDLGDKHGLKLEFRKFIKVEGVPARTFRGERINILEHSAVIMTSRNAVDHFFRMAKEMRIEIPTEMKYICTSETTAFYLQNYVQYRKRKIFFAKNQYIDAMLELVHKHKNETFLLPTSNICKPDLQQALENGKYKVTRACFYKTVPDDLSDVNISQFDLLVFFSPIGITSLFKNFPKFVQGNTLIAAFGSATADAVQNAKLRLDIMAPSPEFPSMTAAVDHHLTLLAKSKKSS